MPSSSPCFYCFWHRIDRYGLMISLPNWQSMPAKESGLGDFSFSFHEFKKRLVQEKSGLKITHILQRCHDSYPKGMDIIKHNLINIQETVIGVKISVKCQWCLIYSYLSISSAMVYKDDPFGKYRFTYMRTQVTLSG